MVSSYVGVGRAIGLAARGVGRRSLRERFLLCADLAM
jgi:hypothetical protein